jgi:hypothetical protein
MADQIQAEDKDIIIWGASAIAREAGLPDRAAAYHLLERGLLPARRVGRKWVTSRGQLRRALTGTGGDRAGGE